MKFMLYLVCALVLILAFLWAAPAAFSQDNQHFPGDLEYKDWHPTNQAPQAILDDEPVPKLTQYNPGLSPQPVPVTANGYDYGLFGVVILTVLGLLGFTLKADRQERRQMQDSLNQLVATNTQMLHEMRRQTEEIRKMDSDIQSLKDRRQG
jgi:hypothetical protein